MYDNGQYTMICSEPHHSEGLQEDFYLRTNKNAFRTIHRIRVNPTIWKSVGRRGAHSPCHTAIRFA